MACGCGCYIFTAACSSIRIREYLLPRSQARITTVAIQRPITNRKQQVFYCGGSVLIKTIGVTISITRPLGLEYY